MRISDWSSDVCSSDLRDLTLDLAAEERRLALMHLGKKCTKNCPVESKHVLTPTNMYAPQVASPVPWMSRSCSMLSSEIFVSANRHLLPLQTTNSRQQIFADVWGSSSQSFTYANKMGHSAS